jgi:hypothetical protein
MDQSGQRDAMTAVRRYAMPLNAIREWHMICVRIWIRVGLRLGPPIE